MELNFPLSPEFNQTPTVQPDGYISLLGAGDLHVEGLTVPELRESLRGVYANILRDPVITVVLKDFEKPYFVASGEVVRPGKYDLRGYTTATQAVAMAGGFSDSAKHSEVLLFRRVSNDWEEVKKVNLKKMRQAERTSLDEARHTARFRRGGFPAPASGGNRFSWDLCGSGPRSADTT